MLLSINKAVGCNIEAIDDSIGRVYGFMFDDQRWVVRYLVVDTGIWLPGRKVLVTPSAIDKPEPEIDPFSVNLTREQVKGSPDIDTDKPVSRQQEIELYKYFNWQPYWPGGFYGEPVMAPYVPVVPPLTESEKKQQSTVEPDIKSNTDPHLRLTKEVVGYQIHASDGHIGHVEDFILDTANWIMRYIVVDTRNWLPGKTVILPADWISDINWAGTEVTVDVSKETIKHSPEYDPDVPLNRDYEERFFDYYGRPKYWIS